jgi:hypothetical protein
MAISVVSPHTDAAEIEVTLENTGGTGLNLLTWEYGRTVWWPSLRLYIQAPESPERMLRRMLSSDTLGGFFAPRTIHINPGEKYTFLEPLDNYSEIQGKKLRTADLSRCELWMELDTPTCPSPDAPKTGDKCWTGKVASGKITIPD